MRQSFKILHGVGVRQLCTRSTRFLFFYTKPKQTSFLETKPSHIPDLPPDRILAVPADLDMSFLQKQYHINKLRKLQRKFYEDQGSCYNAYLYVRQLNRMGMYQQVIMLNNQYLSKLVSKIILDKNWLQYKTDKDYFQKLDHQIDFANQRNKASERPGNDYQFRRRRPSLMGVVLTGWLTWILLQSFVDDNPIKIDHEEKGSFFSRIFGTETNKSDNMNEKKNQPDEGKTKKIDRFINIFQGRTEVMEEKNISTRFADVLGIDEFKEELEEIVDYLKNPKKYLESGAKLPKGLLLVGPPGTGKTLLARALAGEAHCAFFYKSGAEFDEMFVGVGASRVRELFKKAREKAPSIIFIDEIDSIGGNRKANDPSHSRDTINQILTEMDGFKQSDNVIVIGATNFEKSLDPAIKRPGRFDKIIHIPHPDIKGRQQIFEYYLKKIKYDPSIDPHYLARQTSGFTGADIQNMVNVAILNAIKSERKVAETSDFEYALDRISMGVGRKKMFVSEKDKLLTAYHEGGHALTSLLTDGATPLHKVTILPRGGALGFTSMIPENDQLNYTRQGIIASIDVAMGGRAAEELFVGHDKVTSGCSSDLSRATELAYMYVRQLGMQDRVSLISASDRIKTSDQYDYMVDMEVKQILEESYTRVKTLLKKNESKLKQLALELIQKETLAAKDVKALLNI